MKRFWKDVSLRANDGAHGIALDDRILKTPKRADLQLPTVEMAQAVAQEWRDVADTIDPAGMPMTGFANAAIDRVGAERAAFIAGVAAFGESDFFCYRADSPEELCARQDAAWGKWTRWAEQRYEIQLAIIEGIIHRAQPAQTLARMQLAVEQFTDFQLAAASKLTHLSGSLIAVLALAEGAARPDDIWPDLMIDELWQEEQWGPDEFALKNRDHRAAEFADAARFMDLAASA